MRAGKKADAAKQIAKTPSARELQDAKVRKLTQDVEDNTAAMDRMADHVASLEGRLLRAEKQISAMAEALDRSSAKVTSLRTRVEALEKPAGIRPPAQSIAVPMVVDDDDILPASRGQQTARSC